MELKKLRYIVTLINKYKLPVVILPVLIPRSPAFFSWGIPPEKSPPIPGSLGVSLLSLVSGRELLDLPPPPGGNFGPPFELEGPCVLFDVFELPVMGALLSFVTVFLRAFPCWIDESNAPRSCPPPPDFLPPCFPPFDGAGGGGGPGGGGGGIFIFISPGIKKYCN